MIRINRPPCPHPTALENGNYKHARNKEALRDSAHGKCMYCESKINHIDYADVEHIKPKADGKFPQLEFVWENLGYSCAKCNISKGDKYDNACPYVDPYAEDPSVHLFPFGAFLKHRTGSERGQLTIDDIKLNRPELLERRSERLEQIQAAVDSAFRTANDQLRERAITALENFAGADSEYSVFARGLLDAHSVGA